MKQVPVTTNEEFTAPTSKKCYTVQAFAQKNRVQGTWPSTPSVIWALRAKAEENGFNRGAFITVGRRVLIVEEKFWEAVARLQGGPQ